MSDTVSDNSARVRARRSALFMPGSNARALDKARSLDADVIIMDLEDAVAPEAKEAARAQVLTALRAGGYGARERVVRVNPVSTPWFRGDVAAAADAAPDAILVPKVEQPRDIDQVVAALEDTGAAGSLAVWIMIETPRGVLACGEICAASPRTTCLTVGTSDLAKELRLGPSAGRAGLLHALATCVVAARACAMDVLDGVHLDLEDEAGFRAACEQGRTLGFDGKTLIHPRQIAACNAAFGPRATQIEHARRVLEAFETARAAGAAVTVVDGRLVENLHADEARRTLALAEAITARDAR
jgi:citrate lyase subunit beta/citryl-CoA lyase